MDFLRKNEKAFYIILVALCILVFFVFGKENEHDELKTVNTQAAMQEMKKESEHGTNKESEGDTVFVDVKGAVVHQGVYEINKLARVKDVIALAGGFTKEADQTKINLAAKVRDEMVIYVPQIGEEGAVLTSGGTEGKKVNINQATVDELQTLQGIGPAKAAAIIAYREENGPFVKIEDLLNVSGIGEKSLEKIKEQITVQ